MNRDDLYHKAAMTGKSLEELQLSEKVKRLERKLEMREKLLAKLILEGCSHQKELADAKGLPAAQAWQDLMFELGLSHLSRAEAAEQIKIWKAGTFQIVTYTGDPGTLPEYEKPVIVLGVKDVLYCIEGLDGWCAEDRHTGYHCDYIRTTGDQWFYLPEAGKD